LWHIENTVKCHHASILLGNGNPTDFDDGHGAPNKLSGEKSMEISFFALSSKQGPVQGRFKLTHRPISLSTKVPACVRRFETPTPLNDGGTESKKDISMLSRAFLSYLTLKQRARVMC
jgi:hypothetical protein